MVSIPVVPKLSPNHVRIGSRKERLGVQRKKGKPCKLDVYKALSFFY